MPRTKKDYKDMEKYRQYDKRYKQKYYSERRKDCHPHIWTEAELNILKYCHNMTDTELSKVIHHSVQAIQVKRSKLKAKGEM